MDKKEDEFVELLTEQEICEFHEAFNIFDIESDGSIDAKNFVLLINALKQYPSKEVEQILKEMDINNDGQIYFNQFLKIMANRLKICKKDNEEKYLKSLFYELDKNRYYLISLQEIRYIATHSNENISEKDIEFIMKEADTDGDGQISFEEFMINMKN